jgi:hypothetical protein
MGDVLLFDRAAWAKPVAPSLATWWHRVWQLGGTEFGQTTLPFLALCVGMLIYCMHHGLNVHTLVLHPTVAEI